jgi:DnaK suppressor protein
MTPHGDLIRPVQRRNRELRRLLEEQRDRILKSTRSRIREVRFEGGAEAGDVLDSAETTEADIQTDLELALLQMQRETLVRIDAALAELDEGSYGRCISCHGEIATPRLRALPFAIRCTPCEAAYEAAARPRPSAWRVPPDGLNAAA